jgi:hypothetical protein|eukprot:SAG25_NODE_46_length_19040_cov_20.665699_5_plen_95_part_00
MCRQQNESARGHLRRVHLFVGGGAAASCHLGAAVRAEVFQLARLHEKATATAPQLQRERPGHTLRVEASAWERRGTLRLAIATTFSGNLASLAT